jgi:ribosome-binding factor A
LAEGLAKANGFIRSELGQRLEIRYTPELVFHRDVSGPRGDRILELLEQVKPDEQEPPERESAQIDAGAGER